MKLKRGSTSVRRLIFIADSSSTVGAGLANLTYSSSGLVAYYFAGDLSNEVQITLASATLGTFTSGGFVAVDNTNMPGWYEIGIPDAALDAGNEVAIQLRGATNMVPVNVYIELDAVDYQTDAFGALKPTIAGRTLDVSAGGEAGIDLANVGSPTTTLNLSGTTIKTATDVEADTAAILLDTGTDGVVVAAGSKTGYSLVDGSITSDKISDGAITSAKFAANALDAVWSTSVRSLTTFGTLTTDTATAVWVNSVRSLTTFGTLVSDIWTASPISFTDLEDAVNAVGTIVTTINSKIGAFTGSGINTILGFFKALMRNDVSIPSDVGGTYDDADHSLQALAADIAAINVAGGTGARVVTITVNDGTSPLENAKVRAYLSASENYVLSSNASGVVVFNLDDGTWTISITKPGYSFTSQLLVVNGNESQTYSMTQEVIISNPDPDKSVVVITCYDAKTNVEADVKIYLEQMTIPTSSENIAFSGAAQEYISGVNGQIELTLWRNAKYRYRRGQEKDWIEFTPNSATYDVTSIVGY